MPQGADAFCSPNSRLTKTFGDHLPGFRELSRLFWWHPGSEWLRAFQANSGKNVGLGPGGSTKLDIAILGTLSYGNYRHRPCGDRPRNLWPTILKFVGS